jgi:membrane-associated phospholipid phosphatase
MDIMRVQMGKMIDSVKERMLKLLPDYAWKYAAVAFLWNVFTYCGTRPFTDHLRHHSLKTALDNVIPFRPEWIVIYLLAFVFWFFGYYLILREDKEMMKRIVIAEILAKSVCLVFFIVYPTTIARPEILDSNNIFMEMTALIYKIDAPTNLFPSIHCLESWVCFRGAQHLRYVPKWYKPFSFVCCMAICISTVMVKQHVVADFVGAVVVFESCLLLSTYYLGRRKEIFVHE